MNKLKNLFSLKGKNALITGSTQGIGKAIMLGLAEFGANVIIHGRTTNDHAEKALQEAKELGIEAHLIPFDLEKTENLEGYFKQVNEILPIDILILNASIQFRKPWNEITSEEFDRQMNVNVKVSMRLSQLFGSGMIQRGWGRIITIGSVQQWRPHKEMLVYAASKSAQENIIRNLGVQLASSGVTANNIAPGAIATGRNEEVLQNEEYKKIVESKIPTGYVGEPIDCAGLAVLLCSEAGRYINGADIPIDGGMRLPF